MNYGMAIRVALLTALIIMALGIAYFKQDAAWLEEVYAQRYFPLLSGAQRRVSSLLPFSAGDLLYAFAGLYFLRQLWLFIRGWRHPHQKSSLRWQPLLNVLILGLFFLGIFLRLLGPQLLPTGYCSPTGFGKRYHHKAGTHGTRRRFGQEGSFDQANLFTAWRYGYVLRPIIVQRPASLSGCRT